MTQTDAPPLAFFLSGIPGSETTGVAEALAAQPGLFCAQEMGLALQPWSSPAEILRGLVDPGELGAARRRSLALLEEKLSAGPVEVIGDTSDYYFLSLPRIAALHPRATHLCVHRSPLGFTPTWDREAAAGEDGAWEPGRTGLFGILDMVLMLHVLATQPGGAMVLSYDALATGAGFVIKRVVTHLTGAEANPAVRKALGAWLRQRPGGHQPGGPYAALLAELEVPALDAAIQRLAFFPAAEQAPLLGGFVAAALPKLPSLVAAHVAALSALEAAHARDYGRHWVQARSMQMQAFGEAGAAVAPLLAELRQGFGVAPRQAPRALASAADAPAVALLPEVPGLLPPRISGIEPGPDSRIRDFAARLRAGA
jgi:hypothetical protein